MMRVGLAYPCRKKNDDKCTSPISLLYLATSLQQGGFEVRVFDRDAYSDLEQMVADVADFSPSLLGVPVFTSSVFLRSVRDFLRLARERLPETRIVAGAAHTCAMPVETLEWFPEIDFVLVGEADYTIVDLAREIERNSAQPTAPGLCYRSGEEIVSIPAGPPPKDLDAIPIPDRRILWDNYERGIYWRLDKSGMLDAIISSRGCPFACKFCFKVSRGVRMRSAENVLKELDSLASLGIRNVDFIDDLFTTRKSRCIEICNMIREAGFKMDIKVRSRVEHVDAELLDAMKRAGVTAVVYGFESGSQKMLDAMNKKTKVQDNYEAVRMTKKAGLKCYADLFIGFPGETPETIEETLQFLLKARPTAINGGILIPLPSTPVYLEAKANGTLLGDWSVDGTEPYVRLPWAPKREDLWGKYHDLQHRFYRHPAILIGLVRNAPLNVRTVKKGVQFLRRVTGAGG